ncbi:Caudovirus, tape measure, N-terminal [uncultured Caudovirales phage]|uniref:Caudovirus, tape measure, N-terminal n=1 Tax=uncultured Caudovirales phage TaxID=2100421 RepID=A0A6J7X293_9CAUD|nr:Caudovirus, tape measure, N-terminal [uncultured Caudovirales phage]
MATIRELLVSIKTELDAASLRAAEAKAAAGLNKAVTKTKTAVKEIEKGNKKVVDGVADTISNATAKITGALRPAEQKVTHTLDKVSAKAKSTGAAVESSAKQANGSVVQSAQTAAAVMTGAFVAAGAAVAAAGVGVLKLTATVNGMISRVGLFSGSMATAKDSLKELVAISSKTGVSLGAVEETFGRMSLSAKALKADNQRIIAVTDGVAKTMAISGKSAAEMAGALTQLGQAFSSPIVQAEEFRSVLEGAPVLADELAKSIIGPNGTAGALLNLVKKQKLSNVAMFAAIEDALPRINAKFDAIPPNLDRITNRLSLLPVTLSLAFGELEGPQKFLTLLDSLITKTQAYLLENREIITLGLSVVFDTLSFSINAVVVAGKGLVEFFKFITDSKTVAVIIAAIVAAVTNWTTVMLAWQTVTKVATALQLAFNLAMAANPIGLVVTAVAGLVIGLIALAQNWDLVTASVKAAWEWLMKVAAIAGNGITMALDAAIGKTPQQAAAQQAVGGGKGGRSYSATANTTVNINGSTPTPSQAKHLGASFAAGSLNGFQALETY